MTQSITRSTSLERLVSGRQAEQIAQCFLEQAGLQCLATRYLCQMGEIDLVMSDDDTLVFVEVRYRKQHSSHGSAAQSVTARKRQRLRRTAEHYLQKHHTHQPPPCRFDVIAIGPRLAISDVQWIQSAFV